MALIFIERIIFKNNLKINNHEKDPVWNHGDDDDLPFFVFYIYKNKASFSRSRCFSACSSS